MGLVAKLAKWWVYLKALRSLWGRRDRNSP